MDALKLLSRSEMRNIMAGSDPDEDCSYTGGKCLECETPGGVEHWCRHDPPTGPAADAECANIYPAYNSSEVSGMGHYCLTPGG